MAWRTWNSFFSNIRNYFFDGQYTDPKKLQKIKKLNENVSSFYMSLANDFLGPEREESDEALMRIIFLQEGSRASQKAELFEKTLKRVTQEYSAYRFACGAKEIQSREKLIIFLTALIEAEPGLVDNVVGQDRDIMKKVIELILFNATELLTEYSKEKTSSQFDKLKEQVLNQIGLIGLPQEDFDRYLVVEKRLRPYVLGMKNYIAPRALWERANHNIPYAFPYVCHKTAYYKSCYANEMSSSSRRVSRNIQTRMESPKPYQEADVKLSVPQTPSRKLSPPSPISKQLQVPKLPLHKLQQPTPEIASRNLPFPTYWNVFGLNFLWPPYLADALGTILEFIGRGICYGINKCFGRYKNSWVACGLKGIFAGVFIVAKIVTFSFAKVSSPSGWRELGCCPAKSNNLIEPIRLRQAPIANGEDMVSSRRQSEKGVTSVIEIPSVSPTPFARRVEAIRKPALVGEVPSPEIPSPASPYTPDEEFSQIPGVYATPRDDKLSSRIVLPGAFRKRSFSEPAALVRSTSESKLVEAGSPRESHAHQHGMFSIRVQAPSFKNTAVQREKSESRLSGNIR